MTSVEDLQRLRQSTSKVIDIIQSTHERPGGINWAGLACTEAREISNDKGQLYLEVLIEEASPDAQEFCRLVHTLLAEREGWSNVAVVTEW